MIPEDVKQELDEKKIIKRRQSQPEYLRMKTHLMKLLDQQFQAGVVPVGITPDPKLGIIITMGKLW